MARRSSTTDNNILSPIHDLLDEDNREVLASWTTRAAQKPAGTTPKRPSASGPTKKRRFDPTDPSTWTAPNTVVPSSTTTTQSEDAAQDESTQQEGTVVQPDQLDGAAIAQQHGQQDHPPQPSISIQTPADTADLSKGISRLTLAPPDEVSVPAPVPLNPRPLQLTTGELRPVGQADRRFSNKSTSFSTVDSDGGGGRLARDQDAEEEAVQYSSDDEPYKTSGDEAPPVAERGRARRSNRRRSGEEDDQGIMAKSPRIEISDTSLTEAGLPAEAAPPPHPKNVSHSGVFSESQSQIHPRSNYDRSASPSPLSGLDEDAELRKAKGLPVRISPIDEKIPNRHVKMILRGAWGSFQDHDEEEHEYRHEPRLYLVCSDLSNEATYALEWTVGTLLKDGDTLLAISAIEDEHAPKLAEHEEPSLEISMESLKAAQETNSTMSMLTRQTTNQEESALPEKKHLVPAYIARDERSRSRSGRATDRKADDRIKAVEKLESDLLRFVRKTTLQVRCMIEVIHCRSPRHLILNAIDELEPTLVVVGTRGLGTVKNVMMGSFSNYLVTKSSVPVMVARKRLKKARHAKVSSQQIRMTNNLTPFGLPGKRKSLTQARID